MKLHHLLGMLMLAGGATTRVQAQCFPFTQEHVDLLAYVWNAESNTLSLKASDDTHGGTLYASNQCVVIVPLSARFTLPAGTPFGNEGDPLWILPQNPYPGVPYVGVSAERLPAGSFTDPLAIQLTRVEGPGHFLAWQSTSFGSFDIRMDSRDGIGPNDRLTPLVGGHEHYNWGFTTNGVYRIYFQASGIRSGQVTNTMSAETPFTFHVLPLGPYENWTATNWPCECATNIIAAGADPDGDHIPNIFEYAFANDPKVALYTNTPTITFVGNGGVNYGAMRYTRATNATDLLFDVRASSVLGGASEILTNHFNIISNGGVDTVTVRDSLSMQRTNHRFYQLRVELNSP
jgi:surface-anchored protein